MNIKNQKDRFYRVLKQYFPDARLLWDDFCVYLSAYTYENDKYEIDDIFKSDYLLLHEISEILCLKRKGLKIDRNIIIKNREMVYECHLKAIDFEIDNACKERKTTHARKRMYDLISYLDDPYLPSGLINKVRNIIEKYALCSNFGVYALFIYNSKDLYLKVGALGRIHFPKGYYVYIGSTQRGMRKRFKGDYFSHKKPMCHIDYFLNYTKIIDYFLLPLTRDCVEHTAIKMQKHFKFIKNFGSSHSKASSHLFYGKKKIWTDTKRLFRKCL